MRRLNWLDIRQAAAKVTIMAAMKVAYEGSQEDLEWKLGRRDKNGIMRIKNVSKAELFRMNTWVRKSWSTRARRWLKAMPEEIWRRDPWLESTKRMVRGWVRENVGRKGDNAVLWGKWDEDDLREEKMDEECPRPTWTEKQMRRRGEPPRKKQEELSQEEARGEEREKEVAKRDKKLQK